jgi:hypothetical protein
MSANEANTSSETAWSPQMQALAASTAACLDRYSVLLYGLITASFLCLFVAAARLLTVEADEAWILLSTAHAFGVTWPATTEFANPTVTTGGPHLLIHGLLDYISMDVLVHRAVSVIAAAALFIVVYQILRHTGSRREVAITGTALFAAAPGFMLQAGLAMGEVIATGVLFGAVAHWVWKGADSLSAALVTGLLLGAATAARVNMAVAAFALVAYVIVARHQDAKVTRRAILATAVGMLVAWLSMAAYYKAGQVEAAVEERGYIGAAVGLHGGKTLDHMVRSLEIANQHLPLILIVAVVGAWFVGRSGSQSSKAEQRSSELAGVLIFMGVAMLLMWVLMAPIPHLRYLWPAIASLWFAGILLLLERWRKVERPAARLALHGLVAVTCGFALVSGANSLANGEALSLAYQATGTAPRVALPPEQRFRAGADQRALAAFVANQPAAAQFFTFLPPVSYPIVYLSGRSVQPVADLSGDGERYLLINPADYRVFHPGRSFETWRKAYTRPAFQSGGFAALRIIEGAPPPPVNFRDIGRDHLF